MDVTLSEIHTLCFRIATIMVELSFLFIFVVLLAKFTYEHVKVSTAQREEYRSRLRICVIGPLFLHF